MTQQAFLFSNKPKYRIQRHLLFWGAWWIFLSLLYSFSPNESSTRYSTSFVNSSIDSILYLSSHIFLSYTLMYFVIPRYVVKKRYSVAALWVAILICITGMISALTSMYVLGPVKEAILPEHLMLKVSAIKKPDFLFLHLAFLAGLRGSLTVGGIAASIKLMKYWYNKEQLAVSLQKENVESQLQILKAQVHPHFLFNTLNNIYAHAQKTAPVASHMICGLSDILRYMLYECNKPLVPLDKELKMLKEYVELERVRYGNSLEMHIDVPNASNGLDIAPLILLPFVENCFKHGTSNMVDQPWLSLTITLRENEMTMKLLNSKPVMQIVGENGGLGIKNVKKRLELLYPEKHELVITEEDEVFIVSLKMKLHQAQVQPVQKPQSSFAVLPIENYEYQMPYSR